MGVDVDLIGVYFILWIVVIVVLFSGLNFEFLYIFIILIFLLG